MRLSRPSAIAGAVSAFGSICIPRFPGNAAEFSYKLSTDVAANAPLTARALEAGARMYRESNGQFELKVYPNSVLGSDPDVLQQVRVGTTEFTQIGNAIIASLVPVAGLDGLGSYPTYDAAWSATDGALGNYIRAAIAKAGIYTFSKTWDGSLRQIMNNTRPVNTPDDLRGLKIRVAQSPVSIALFRGLGATPTPLAYRDVYTSPANHLVDGVEMGYYIVEDGKLYEVLKYASGTNHVWTAIAMIANADAWQRLPRTFETSSSTASMRPPCRNAATRSRATDPTSLSSRRRE